MFDDLKPKWILEEGHFIMGKVKFHKELAHNHKNVQGGGWFEFDHENKYFILSGKSEDFGYADMQDVAKALKEGKAGRFIGCNKFAKDIFYHRDELGHMTRLN